MKAVSGNRVWGPHLNVEDSARAKPVLNAKGIILSEDNQLPVGGLVIGSFWTNN